MAVKEMLDLLAAAKHSSQKQKRGFVSAYTRLQESNLAHLV